LNNEDLHESGSKGNGTDILDGYGDVDAGRNAKDGYATEKYV
jgi:hypothetical protein